MDFKKNYYAVLGVAPQSSKEEIRAAFRKLIRIHHPDRNLGNPESEERTKEINEAYGVLGNDISRKVYDDYLKEEQRIKTETQKEEKAKNTENVNTVKGGKRSYERRTVVQHERKVFVRGTIKVKYWAEQDHDEDIFIMREVFYKLHPTWVEAEIVSTNIHGEYPPLHFSKAYSTAELFATAVPQPVRCRVISEKGKEYFKLNLTEIRIKDPIIKNVTKHDDVSLGELEGEFFAHMIKYEDEEKVEIVTECYGETGRSERNSERDKDFYRKEYFHSDCTSYWGPWVEIVTASGTRSNRAERTSVKKPVTVEAVGCGSWLWLPVSLLALVLWPKLVLGILVFALIIGLFSLGGRYIGRILPVLGLFYFLILAISLLRLGGKSGQTVRRDPVPAYDTLKSSIKPLPAFDSLGRDTPLTQDSLITHFLVWKDYDSTRYQVSLEIPVSAVRRSSAKHNNLEIGYYARNLGSVYKGLDEYDGPSLDCVFRAFDSIRKAENLDQYQLAEMLVSCVQSIPYYLVLDGSCSDDYSNDEFIRSYLRQCQQDCCYGNAKFGIRSPVEFLSDLKGDCDTRSLFLYSMLKQFKFDVAILSSDYYHHAILAVAFDNISEPLGLSININNQNFYLWETTGPGFRPGQLPPETSDLSKWELALLNINKQ